MEIALALIEMFKSIITTFAGLFLIWAILAAITSQIQEWISQWFMWRPIMLEDAIRNIMGSDHLTAVFYNHPLIRSLHSKRGTRKPSYIPNKQFASMLFDMFINAGADETASYDVETDLQRMRTNITSMRRNPNSDMCNLAVALDTILVDVSLDGGTMDTSIVEARQRIEAWYDDAMDRMAEEYRRKLQVWFIVIGICVAFVLNADSLAIANTLWRGASTAAQNEQSQLEIDGDQESSQSNVNPQENVVGYVSENEIPFIPIGWSSNNMPKPGDVNGWFMKLGGILFSGIVAAQGAPIWFEFMRKLFSTRSASRIAANQEEGK